MTVERQPQKGPQRCRPLVSPVCYSLRFLLPHLEISVLIPVGSHLFAGRQTRVDRLEIFSPELQQVFAEFMLPHLDLKDLVYVSCSCKALRDAACLRDEPWRRAATDFLPLQHPPLSGSDRAGVQRALQNRVDARRNILAGRVGSRLDLCSGPHVIFKLQFSVSFTLLAALFLDSENVSIFSHILVFAVHEGSSLWTTDLSLIKESCGMPADVYWADMEWRFGSDALSVCVMSNTGNSGRSGPNLYHLPANINLHLFKLSACSGAVVDPSSLQLSSVQGFTDQTELIRQTRGHKLAFSRKGGLLAAVHITRAAVDNLADDYQQASTIVFVLEVKTCQILLSLPRLVSSQYRQ